MKIRTALVTPVMALLVLAAAGCAVQRDQETVGAYVDDAGITTTVKGELFNSKEVGGASIHVETLNGTVMLSGFAKNATEKTEAENLTRKVKGVKAVKNQIAVRP